MTEKRIPIFTFTQRIGNTNFTVRAYCDDDIAVTYEDKLLELIRSGVLQADASEKPSSSSGRRNTKSPSSETRKGRIVSASAADIWSIICPIPNC